MLEGGDTIVKDRQCGVMQLVGKCQGVIMGWLYIMFGFRHFLFCVKNCINLVLQSVAVTQAQYPQYNVFVNFVNL